MASAVTVQRLGFDLSGECLVHKPNSVASVVVSPDQGTTKQWRDMQYFSEFGFWAANHTLTGNGVTNMKIQAASDTSGTNATVVVDSGTLSGTAVGNGGFLECVSTQIREVEAAAGLAKFTLRYVAGYITVANASDTC